MKRTALTRKTPLRQRAELKRTAPMRRRRELKARASRTIGRATRAAGPTIQQRNLVLDRADGCCERCGRLLHDGTQWIETHSYHHRRARGMGGSRQADVHAAYQLLLLCGTGTTDCHGWLTAHPKYAESFGWIVRHGQDPADVPVWVHILQGFAILEPSGTYREVS